MKGADDMIRCETRQELLLELGEELALYEVNHPEDRIKFEDSTTWITTPSGEPRERINADYDDVLRDIFNKRDAGTLYPLGLVVDTIKERIRNAVEN